MESNVCFMEEAAAREAICEIGRRMYERGYIAANDGNISIRIGKDRILCTPTGISKGYMTPDMHVVLNSKGEVIEGSFKPSSEIKMHLRVYAENEQVQAVTHAHPPFATSFAVAGIPLDKAITSEAVVMLGIVPVAPYATPSTQEVPDSVAPFCKKYNAVLLANHGALTWGKDITEAWFRMESLEHYAKIMHYTKGIGKENLLNSEQVKKLIKIRESMGINSGGVPEFSE